MRFLVTLYIEFFKIGLFSIGGGLATLPFLYRLADKYEWFDATIIPDMIAISESTPGPIGINLATFTGVQHSGILGGIIATLGIITPSIVIIILISKFLDKFHENKHVNDIFSTMRPAVIGLIATIGIGLMSTTLLDMSSLEEGFNIINLIRYKEIIFFGILIFLTQKYNKHPLFFISLSALVGIIFAF